MISRASRVAWRASSASRRASSAAPLRVALDLARERERREADARDGLGQRVVHVARQPRALRLGRHLALLRGEPGLGGGLAVQQPARARAGRRDDQVQRGLAEVGLERGRRPPRPRSAPRSPSSRRRPASARTAPRRPSRTAGRRAARWRACSRRTGSRCRSAAGSPSPARARPRSSPGGARAPARRGARSAAGRARSARRRRSRAPSGAAACRSRCRRARRSVTSSRPARIATISLQADSSQPPEPLWPRSRIAARRGSPHEPGLLEARSRGRSRRRSGSSCPGG